MGFEPTTSTLGRSHSSQLSYTRFLGMRSYTRGERNEQSFRKVPSKGLKYGNNAMLMNTQVNNQFDVIVIGGGHAGCEAAYAAAKRGCRTALLTLRADRIGFMSCNPAVGGLAKGQLVKEIDALGGLMGVNTDLNGIQFRRLNASKGPAVRSSRAQCDKKRYALSMQDLIGRVKNLTVLEGEGEEVVVRNGQVMGLCVKSRGVLKTKAVVITSGTFLSAVMHMGLNQEIGGRQGDSASYGLSRNLKELGFRLHRLKTGTPPRLHKKSIDWSVLEEQPGDEKPVPFSFYRAPQRFPYLEQVSCYITYTNEETHNIIEENFASSPMFSGQIQGIGPRYCPSIEDKVSRFRDRQRHQVFLEPEGQDVDEVYVNGVSTSLPREIQEKFIHSINGLHKAIFLRHGYAVEYDAVDARQLKATLESKQISGLFLAGQVNGTSGYEEAGAQGLIAGVNASIRALEETSQKDFIVSRLEGYAGVMIDDLVTKGTEEPYRMFTSRAEYRLLLREDNADLRLTEKAFDYGLVDEEIYKRFVQKRENVEAWKGRLRETFFNPTEQMNQWCQSHGMHPLKDRISAENLLKRPEVNWTTLKELSLGALDGIDAVSESEAEQLETQTKYAGYIKRDLETLEGVRRNESFRIPLEIDFERIPGLSNEIKGLLKKTLPETIGQASRIPGITPAAIANLLIFCK